MGTHAHTRLECMLLEKGGTSNADDKVAGRHTFCLVSFNVISPNLHEFHVTALPE